jgi:hypothetical protein
MDGFTDRDWSQNGVKNAKVSKKEYTLTPKGTQRMGTQILCSKIRRVGTRKDEISARV